MDTRSITTTHEHEVCDVCGRTLLRGEHTQTFVAAGRRHEVCELCVPHALNDGWMREGTVPQYDESALAAPRRGSIVGRLRPRAGADGRRASRRARGPRSLDDELGADPWGEPEPEPLQGDEPPPPRRSARRAGTARQSAPPPAVELSGSYEPQREPRHVHAIPTDAGHKAAVAVNVFNGSEHCRTIAGVARSLGTPAVNVRAGHDHAGSVWVTVAWELCWYRYEVDIADQRGFVRLDAQGYELSELPEQERVANAAANENGQITLA